MTSPAITGLLYGTAVCMHVSMHACMVTCPTGYMHGGPAGTCDHVCVCVCICIIMIMCVREIERSGSLKYNHTIRNVNTHCQKLRLMEFAWHHALIIGHVV